MDEACEWCGCVFTAEDKPVTRGDGLFHGDECVEDFDAAQAEIDAT